MSIAAVVIGRNEGARLLACLASLDGKVTQIIYVDSGSTDGSVDAAKSAGAKVIPLDMSQPFTAARARNVGLKVLGDEVEFVQVIDGDCILREGWIESGLRFLTDHPAAAVVCGRRRELHRDASVYNQLIDDEWDTPVGQVTACGGDALMRLSALQDVGGYRESMIAGEEPELCLRLRREGWQIWRLDKEMTWHDAALSRFGQWWQRSKRAGHAFAEGAALHGAAPEKFWVAETRRAVLWGMVLPVFVGVTGFVSVPFALLVLALYGVQVARLTRRENLTWAAFTTLGKIPEALGVLQFHWVRLRGGRSGIIEYK